MIKLISWVISEGSEYRLFSLLFYDNQMGLKKYNYYATRVSYGKRPQTPILAPKWAKWALKAPQKFKIEIKTEIYV